MKKLTIGAVALLALATTFATPALAGPNDHDENMHAAQKEAVEHFAKAGANLAADKPVKAAVEIEKATKALAVEAAAAYCALNPSDC
jgi:hypothetical protein